MSAGSALSQSCVPCPLLTQATKTLRQRSYLVVTGGSTVAALEPARPLPGLPMSCTSRCSCGWESRQRGSPSPWLLTLADSCPCSWWGLPSHGRATPWHSLSPGVYRHFPININQEMVKAVASGLPFLVFSREVLLTARLFGWAVPTGLLSSALRMWGLRG